MSDFIETKIGNCLTEYKHKSFTELCNKSMGYSIISQFGGDKQLSSSPKCCIGEICYAIIQGQEIKLWAKIDSGG